MPRMWQYSEGLTLQRQRTASTGPRITPILSQESERLFHADARRQRANALAFPAIGMGRKYYFHDFLAVDVAVHSVAPRTRKGM